MRTTRLVDDLGCAFAALVLISGFVLAVFAVYSAVYGATHGGFPR